MDSLIDEGLRYEAPHAHRWRRACSLASALLTPHTAFLVFELRWRSAAMPETLQLEDTGTNASRPCPCRMNFDLTRHCPSSPTTVR